ncbi:uncharacterized protein LOC134259332 [Saccostrea cucullata]|uniref:uncharacterized protein LOC134259332 n=1 Tax=Saccostrea cuccullata TaxID=36930 RepID=UPI002ED3F947
MKLIVRLFTIGLLLIAKKCLSRRCSASLPTVQSVESCPTNEQDWRYREKLKNCNDKQQDCSSKRRFTYHCAVNEWGNATIEVCAPMKIVFGHCVEFNVKGARIQYNRQSCRGFTEPCPVHYDSTDVYKYPECFKIQQPLKSSTEIKNGDDASKNMAVHVKHHVIDSPGSIKTDDENRELNNAVKISKNLANNKYLQVSSFYSLLFLGTVVYALEHC